MKERKKGAAKSNQALPGCAIVHVPLDTNAETDHETRRPEGEGSLRKTYRDRSEQQTRRKKKSEVPALARTRTHSHTKNPLGARARRILMSCGPSGARCRAGQAGRGTYRCPRHHLLSRAAAASRQKSKGSRRECIYHSKFLAAANSISRLTRA